MFLDGIADLLAANERPQAIKVQAIEVESRMHGRPEGRGFSKGNKSRRRHKVRENRPTGPCGEALVNPS
jgi:hypothetical protein